MLQKLLILFIFLFQLSPSQKIEKIEFEHSNSIILGKGINITFEPIKNKKGKVRINIKKMERNMLQEFPKKSLKPYPMRFRRLILRIYTL